MPTDTENAASQAMKVLTAQYYNAITAGLKLSPAQFQLAQGNVALGNTSQDLWAIMDAIPPLSISNLWTSAGFNSFSSNYGLVLSRIQSSESGAFLKAMGNYYPAWIAYLQKNPCPAGTTMASYFQNWAISSGMPPQQANAVGSLYGAAANDPIFKAQNLYNQAGGAGSIMAYTKTIAAVEGEVSMAPSGNVNLNSLTTSSDISKTWASGGVEGFFEDFFGNSSVSYDAQTSLLTEAGIEMTISFTHVDTVPVIPQSQGTLFDPPNTYQPWYVSAALLTAYTNNNYNTWQSGSPDWNSFFGPGGSLPRVATSLIVVDGISITLKSTNSIASSSQQSVKAAFSAGFFPFFGISGEGGWSNSCTFDDNGCVCVTSTCPTGNPQILGINVSPVANVLTAQQLSETKAALRQMMTSANPRRAALAPAPLLGAVNVAWSAVALQGLHNLGLQPAVEQLIVGFVNAWASNNATGWPLGVPQQYQSGHPAYTATARVTAINGADRAVTISNFV